MYGFMGAAVAPVEFIPTPIIGEALLIVIKPANIKKEKQHDYGVCNHFVSNIILPGARADPVGIIIPGCC